MQPHLVHQTVHDECRPRHVAGVFHKGNEGIENKNLRQEDYHRPHAANYAVHYHVFQHSVGHSVANEVAK